MMSEPRVGPRIEDEGMNEDTMADESIADLIGTSSQQSRPVLTVLTGLDAGRTLALDAHNDNVLGRSPRVRFSLDDDSVSRRHCIVEVRPGHPPRIRDLGSTNGTHVNGEPVTDGGLVLEEGDRIQLSASVVLKFGWQDDLEEAVQRRLYHSAVRDALTGTYNKRYFMDRLKTEFAWALRNARPLTCVVFDLDHFKRINDTWGHAAGDEVLQTVAARALRMVRTEDVLCRFGGEEFVLLMRETPMPVALRIAERLRQQVAGTPVTWEGKDIPVTLSAGLASSDEAGMETGQDLFMVADNRLYDAKSGGRNRVVGPQR